MEDKKVMDKEVRFLFVIGILAFVISILMIAGILSKELRMNDYCKDKGWDGGVWSLNGNTCYKNINDSSGLGTSTIYSGKIDLNKELKEK